MPKRFGIIPVIYLLAGISLGLLVRYCKVDQPLKEAGNWTLPVVVNNAKAVENETISMPSYMKQVGAKVVLLEFNATWGEPCLAEIPYYQDLYDKYHDQGLEVISIFIDNSEALHDAIVKVITKDLYHVGGESGKITFPICWDLTQKVKEYYGFTIIPKTYLINEENKIVYEHGGFTEELMKELDLEIKKLLSKS